MARKVWNFVFIGIIVLLVAALTFSVYTIVQKNKDITSAEKQIKQNESTIEEQKANNTELESKLKASEENNSKIQSELDSVKQEKEKLQNENKGLKDQIQKLKAAKKAQAQAAVNSAAKQNPQPTGKVCYLTFDDGPTNNTLEILKILDEYQIKATFFVIDTPQTEIEYVKQIHAAGHTVGLHSASHNYAQIYSSTDAYFADLNKISNSVKNIIGIESKVIRFPGGGSNMVSKKYSPGIMTKLAPMVSEKGYTYFDWNVSSGDADSVTPSTTKIINNVLAGAKNKNSICVLMHDAKAKTTTVQALPKIIEGLKNMGFSFAPLTAESHGYHHSINN